MDRTFIEPFATAGRDLVAAIRGLTPEELRATPGPGAWSILQLVIHLADSDAIAIDRMKRVLTEDNPTLLYADETAYVRELFCDEQSVEDAVLLIDVGRRQFARVLRKVPDAAFERFGTHNRRGRMTLGRLVAEYTEHLAHHLRFLHAKRDRLGKPVTDQGRSPFSSVAGQ
jgi:uncharacterized damage-inducible protein DinB